MPPHGVVPIWGITHDTHGTTPHHVVVLAVLLRHPLLITLMGI